MYDKIKYFINDSKNYFKIALVVIFYAFVALFGAGFTDTKSEWYMNLTLPKIQPPSEYFGYVWTFLYILLTVITSIIVYNNQENQKLKRLFITNGLLNILWTYTFFNLQNPVASFIIILAILIVGYMIYNEINSINPTLSYLFIIYLIWIVFAGYLNYMILFLN